MQPYTCNPAPASMELLTSMWKPLICNFASLTACLPATLPLQPAPASRVIVSLTCISNHVWALGCSSNASLHLKPSAFLKQPSPVTLHHQTEAWAALESLSETAKGELQLQKERRVESFQVRRTGRWRVGEIGVRETFSNRGKGMRKIFQYNIIVPTGVQYSFALKFQVLTLNL